MRVLTKLVAVSLTMIGLVVLTAPRVQAAAAFVQKGTVASGSSTVTPTLPGSSTSGNLLVATIVDINSGCASDNITAPAGWTRAATICRGGTGPLQLWYYPNNPGGISSVAFSTGSAGANARAQLSEYSGVATSSPVDENVTLYQSTSGTSLTITTSGTISTSGEVAIAAFTTSSGLSSFTTSGSWVSLVADASNGIDANYLLGPTSGSTLTATVTSNPGTNYAALLVTFLPGCSGGSILVKASPTLAFSSVTLNGYDRTVSATASITVDDQSGAGAGWNLTATSTTFTTGSATLPTTATRVTAGSASAATGNCSLPTNSITYPVTLPAASVAPTAVKVFNAASTTGKGASSVSLTFQITVPGSAKAGSYSSTWTFTAASGP